MNKGIGAFNAGSFAPKVIVRYKGAYIPPGGRTVLPKRIPRKLRPGEVRPAIYYKFNQTIELSDGATVKRKSVFPKLQFKMLMDQRNAVLWNPSKPNLKALELDASGRLAKFRMKFGDLESQKSEADQFDLDDLLSDGAEQVKTGRLHKPTVGKKKK